MKVYFLIACIIAAGSLLMWILTSIRLSRVERELDWYVSRDCLNDDEAGLLHNTEFYRKKKD